ncbi:MAG: penicillin-binding transpeptidase domain-containing protein [Acidimicrobiia bacterium]|nr:penicillin-binding transpeptidase domain-containing protein [Acidimicrobiia bacterium]
MNRSIRHVGWAVVVLFLALAGNLVYLQVIKADELANDPRNIRTLIRDFSGPRGDILTSDGEVVARSVEVDDEFEFQRLYPLGGLMSHIGGYFSFSRGSTGVEAAYNDELTGRDFDLQVRNLEDFVLGKENTGNVVLSVSAGAQRAAADALAGRRGSVVVLDPNNGEIIAMYSNPTFDPQPLASHDIAAADAEFRALEADPAKPDLARAYREIYPPGSSFKIVTSAAALDEGLATPTEPVFPSISELTLPLTNTTLSNFGNGVCGGNLTESFVQSCNTTFGQLGLELGEQFPPDMERFGIYDAPPLDLRPGAATSTGPEPGSFAQNQPLFAFAGIGQGEVATTPLQMALAAAAVANGGRIAEPHVGREIRDDDGAVISRIRPGDWMTAMPAQTAAEIAAMMTEVVQRGTGTAAALPDVTVAGKTGTAENSQGPVDHAWFVGFAPAEAPRYAIAVIVENSGSGGVVAAPVAAQVLGVLL